MPVLGEERRDLVGPALNGDNVLAAGDGRDERVFTETAEGQGEALEIIVGEFLVWKSQHVVLKPDGPDFRRQPGTDLARQIHAGDAGSASLAGRFNLEHRRSPGRL